MRKEVGEAWEGKVETENLAGPRVQLLLESAGPTEDAEEWRQTHEGLCWPAGHCYPHLDRTLGLHLVFRAIKK